MQERQSRRNKGNAGRLTLPVVVLLSLVAALVIIGGGYYGLHRYFSSENSSALFSGSTGTVLKPDPEGVLSTTSESFRMIAKKIGPAVVNVKSTRGGKAAREDEGEGEDGFGGDAFGDLFEQFGMRNPFRHREQMPQTALGSGIMIDRQGHIVTNNHVIDGATEIVVSMSESKTEIKAEVVGADAKSDLAVLKLLSLPGNLPEPAEWADSDKVEVGDWAVAIGSPFSLGQSVTVGIVSAKGRRNAPALGGAPFASDLLQTDAAINPGNSGGPLCDLEGKVMGVNTAIYTRNGGYMGIGFAIPSNTAKDIVGRLLKEGKIVRGWIGVMIQGLEPDMAKELGVKSGVGVHSVVAGGPAAKAGLKAGDIVVAVNGRPISEMNELQQQISELKPGQTVTLKAISYLNKKSREVTIKVGEQPKDGGVAASQPKEDKPDRLGLIVEETPKGEGVVVRSVRPESIADQVGIQRGDIIVRANRQALNSVEAYRKIAGSAKAFSLEIRRKNQSLFLQFPLAD